MSPSAPAVALRGAAVDRGGRRLWSDLDLRVEPGEFVTVLGPNGSGKSTLLSVLLGLLPLAHGEVLVGGERPHRGSSRVGYVPQQRTVDPLTPLRGRDLVGLGLDGHRWGPGWGRARARRAAVDAALEAVGATALGDAPAGRLSGGEQQRLRVAQALVGDPQLVLAGYKEWALSTLEPGDKRVCFLFYLDGQAVGYATNEVHETYGEGIIFGARPNIPAKNLYVDLLNYTKQYMWDQGLKRVRATTQVQNHGVQRAWVRMGLFPARSYCTVHINALLQKQLSMVNHPAKLPA